MDLSILPIELESIIIDYVNQMFITEKYDKVMKQLKEHLLITENKISYLLIKRPRMTVIQHTDPRTLIVSGRKLITKGDLCWLVVKYNMRLRELDRKIMVRYNIVPYLREKGIRFWDMPNPRQYLPINFQ